MYYTRLESLEWLYTGKEYPFQAALLVSLSDHFLPMSRYATIVLLLNKVIRKINTDSRSKRSSALINGLLVKLNRWSDAEDSWCKGISLLTLPRPIWKARFSLPEILFITMSTCFNSHCDTFTQANNGYYAFSINAQLYRKF